MIILVIICYLVMILDKIIDRGEKLDIIVDKTDALADTADVWWLWMLLI